MGYEMFNVNPDMRGRTKREILLTVRDRTMDFSVKAIREIGNPEAASVQFDELKHMMLIPEKKGARNTIAFRPINGRTRTKTRLCSSALSAELLRRAGIKKLDGMIRFHGVKADDREALIFDLSKVEKELKSGNKAL